MCNFIIWCTITVSLWLWVLVLMLMFNNFSSFLPSSDKFILFSIFSVWFFLSITFSVLTIFVAEFLPFFSKFHSVSLSGIDEKVSRCMVWILLVLLCVIPENPYVEQHRRRRRRRVCRLCRRCRHRLRYCWCCCCDLLLPITISNTISQFTNGCY